jgi:hypothetical protein
MLINNIYLFKSVNNKFLVVLIILIFFLHILKILIYIIV